MAYTELKTENADVSVVMRGVAIFGIIMHNWLHWLGFATENEFSFVKETSVKFLTNLGNNGLMHSVGDVLSFIGWVGVCAFVFLSGYGLEKKYGDRKINVSYFLWKQWKKLSLLMIAGVVFFMFWNWNDNGWKYLFSLTMLVNFVSVDLFPVFVYWYFGLAFELYLLWLLIRKLNLKWLIAIGVAFMLLQGIMFDSQYFFFVRLNFVGWEHVFIFGMICARALRNMSLKWWISALIAIVGFALVLLCNFDKWCWLLLLPFISVAVVWSTAEVIVKLPGVKQVGIWLGGISAFVFACHPIVRALVLSKWIGTMNKLSLCMVYVLGTLLLSYIYEKVYRKIV